MKIKFITLNIDYIGGVESVLTNLANYFVTAFNYEIEIISFFKNNSQSQNKKLHSQIKKTYLDIEAIKETNRFSQYFNILKYNKKIKNFLKNLDCDVLIGTEFFLNMIIALNRKKLNYKTIVTEHSDYYQHGRLVRLLRIIFYRKTNNLVVLTESAKEKYGKYLKNVKVINNAVSFKEGKISTCENKKIIALGRLSEEKGHLRLIDIFKEINKSYPDWELNIYGEGGEERKIKEKIKKYGLESKINLLKFTDNVKKELLNSSIHVIPSFSEGFPMVLLEAMECGVPTISFNLSGTKEIITNGKDGILVENIQEFIEELKKLMSSNENRKKYGEEAKKNSKNYNIDYIASKWKEIFEEKRQYD